MDFISRSVSLVFVIKIKMVLRGKIEADELVFILGGFLNEI